MGTCAEIIVGSVDSHVAYVPPKLGRPRKITGPPEGDEQPPRAARGTGLQKSRNHREAETVFLAPVIDTAEHRWFVVSCFPQAERLAVSELTRMGYTAYAPTQEVLVADRVTPTIKHRVEKLLWPGYAVVRFARDTKAWHAIVSAQGVRGLLGDTSERPSPIARGWIEDLQATEHERRLPIKPVYDDLGHTFQIATGAFAGHEAECLSSTPAALELALDVFGRMTLVTVPRASVQKVAK